MLVHVNIVVALQYLVRAWKHIFAIVMHVRLPIVTHEGGMLTPKGYSIEAAKKKSSQHLKHTTVSHTAYSRENWG